MIMAPAIVTRPSEEANSDSTRAPNQDAHGPQGAALVLELQRLRRAFDDQFLKYQHGSHERRSPSGLSARSPHSQAGQSKRRRRSRIDSWEERGRFHASQNNGGVLVSTDGLKRRRHVEDGSLASLKSGPKQINADHQDLALAA